MKTRLTALCASLLALCCLSTPAPAQLQPLAEDGADAVLMSVPQADVSEVLAALHLEPGPAVTGLYRHPPTGEAVAMLASESGLYLHIAVGATDDRRISSVRLPAGARQMPQPPPEAAIPDLLRLPDPVETIAFVNVAVVPMDEERVLRDHTVVVRSGRILEVGPSAAVAPPEDALVIDSSGHYLMPGLSEMHAHIPAPQQGEDALQRTLFLFLANGVTTIRGMLGHPNHLELRARAEGGDILSPRIYTSSPSLNGNSAPDPEVGVGLVEEHHAAGYDFLKIHPGLSRETYDAVVETARGLGMQWAGHVPADVGLYRALEVGQITIDHLDTYVEGLAGHGEGFSTEGFSWFGLGVIDEADEGRITELAVRTREAGVWNVPTQSLMEHLLSPDDPQEMIRRPEMRYMPAQTLRQWAQAKPTILEQAETPERAARYLDVRRQLILALQREGAGLLLGADAPQLFNVPGFSAHRELQYLVDAGLTPYEALATGTRNPAAYLETDEWGTIAEGAAADLVLLTANPLEDIGNASAIAGVVVRGAWLPAAEIERRLGVIEASIQE